MMLVKHIPNQHRYKGWLRDTYSRSTFKCGIPDITCMNVNFFQSCIYKEDDVKHTGINKIFGITNGFHGEKIIGKICPTLVNSFLIGWQPSFDINRKYNNLDPNNRIDIFLVTDHNGVEERKKIAKLPLNTSTTISIINKENINNTLEYKIIFDSISISSYFHISYNTKLGYYLYPYFGGKSTPPWNMNYVLSVNVEYNGKTKYII